MDQQVITLYGVIVTLSGVIAYQYKSEKALQKRFDELQEKRIMDVKETENNIGKPLSKIAELTKKIYDNSIPNKRGN